MTLMKKIRRSYRKNQYDLLGLMLHKYPRFIVSEQVDRLENIPVFVFHNVTAEGLEPQLMYLAENGYRTLSADQLYARFTAGELCSAKEVVLTFDDGDRSLWSVAYPLLKKYGFTAVAFIVPGLIAENESGWGPASEHLCSWREIQEIHENGVIDFQSHSLYHHTIFVSPKIIDFVSPSSSFAFLTDYLFPVMNDEAEPQFPDSFPLGTPIYESDYRLQAKPRYIDSIGLRRACVDFVKRHGSEDFFQHRQWKQKLNGFVRQVFKDFSTEARYEQQEERTEAIRQNFRKAKGILEKRLDGKNVRHFCFPEFSGCPSAVEISGEEGHVTSFWGGLVPKFAQSHPKPIAIPRLNPVYIWRLPGKGRKSLGEVLKRKYGSVIIQRMKKYELCK